MYFFWSFDLPFFLLSWHACYIKGRSLRCSPGQSKAGCCAVMVYVWEGSEREQWCLLHSPPAFSHSLCYPQSNWAFLVLIPGRWVCVCSRTLWVSPTNSPGRLGVSPAAASTPTDVFNQWFEALFPQAGALGYVVCFAPCCSSWSICAGMWDHGVC